MDGWVDGWMDGGGLQRHRWMDGWMDRWIDRTVGCVSRSENRASHIHNTEWWGGWDVQRRGEKGSGLALASTRDCYYQHCMLNSRKSSRGGAIYCAILIAKYNGGGVQLRR